MLPAWLGAGQALQQAVDVGKRDLLLEMSAEWPFFATRISMLEMVFAKSDAGLSAYYDEILVPGELQHIGEALRAQLSRDVDAVLDIRGTDSLLEKEQWVAETIRLRNIYTDPLNFLQASLLQCNREVAQDAQERAIMVTIAGIAAGMRNTG